MLLQDISWQIVVVAVVVVVVVPLYYKWESTYFHLVYEPDVKKLCDMNKLILKVLDRRVKVLGLLTYLSRTSDHLLYLDPVNISTVY